MCVFLFLQKIARSTIIKISPTHIILAVINHDLNSLPLGTGGPTKTYELLEKFKWEGGHFQSKKLCRFWTFKQVFFGDFFEKLQHDYLKMRGGGSKAIWNFSENSSILVWPLVL